MTSIEQIKTEIERRIKELSEAEADYREEGCDSISALLISGISELQKILSFISALESENTVPEDIEEAAKTMYPPGINDNLRFAFIAGAKWQKEQYHFFNEAWADNMQAELDMNYENGKQAMKEQMMKEAVKGEIFDDYNKDTCEHHLTILSTVPSEYKDGDKVRIIIVKEN